MASPLDPEDDTIPQEQPSTLADRWRTFAGDPALRAALMQTGIALLQPRGPGQSALGQIANSIGEGAAAAGRETANEEATANQESIIQARKDNSEARLNRADAAMLAAQSRGGGSNLGLKDQLKTQAAFRTWLTKTDFLESSDPILNALGVKSKAEVIRDPALRRRAFDLFSQSGAANPPEGTVDDGSDTTAADLARRRAAPNPTFGSSMQNPDVAARMSRLRAAFQNPKTRDRAGQDIENLKQYFSDPSSIDLYMAGK